MTKNMEVLATFLLNREKYVKMYIIDHALKCSLISKTLLLLTVINAVIHLKSWLVAYSFILNGSKWKESIILMNLT